MNFSGSFVSAVTSLCFLALVSGCNSSSGPAGAGSGLSCHVTGGSHFLARANEISPADSVAKPSWAGAKSLKRLRGHLLPGLSNDADQGLMDETQRIPVTVVMQLPDPGALAQTIEEMYRPGSPKFHQFITPEEFRARFAPGADQVDKVTSYLAGQGLRSVSVDKSGFVVHATGSVGDMNRAFNTEIHLYRDAQGNGYHAPQVELQVPADLAIQGVQGLENRNHAHTHLQGPIKNNGQVTSKNATGPSGGYSPADIRSAYNIPSSLDGSGQTLGLFELDGYNASDITAYEQQFGLPAAPLQNVLLDGVSGSAGGGAAEVTLDIELMLAVAPKAAKIIVYEGPNSSQGSLDVYAKIANDNIAKSISSSWGSSEGSVSSSFIQSENAIFMQMAAQGQTIYSAAGDAGANDNGSSLSIDDPSGQPYVVAVGGTSLTTASNGAYGSETTWNDSSGGGGGGVSTVWTIPSWQQGLASSANKASSTMRNIPDVALNSDSATGYSIYTGGGWGVWGGTSCAAPLWAGFNALVNQQRAAKGLGPIGYITPTLYALGKSARFGSDFHDIADNSNNGYYPAVSGFDDATGWGSLNGANLLNDLAQGGSPVTSCGP